MGIGLANKPSRDDMVTKLQAKSAKRREQAVYDDSGKKITDAFEKAVQEGKNIEVPYQDLSLTPCHHNSECA
jgi:hypothetical protein